MGGMFCGRLMSEVFAKASISTGLRANIIESRFDPAIGALLLAYRHAGMAIGDDLLTRLDQTK